MKRFFGLLRFTHKCGYHLCGEVVQMSAVIMALANQIGGVGKTATTVNLAGVYQRKGLRTLVVDLDPRIKNQQ